MAEGMISFKLKSSLSELDTLCRNLEQFLKSLELPDTCSFEIHLAMEEIFTNIVTYGYTEKTEHWIKIFISFANELLTIRIEDDGVPFNPLRAKEPDLKSPLEERKIGGLGLHLIKQLMNDIAYERHGNKNVLTLKKNLRELPTSIKQTPGGQKSGEINE